MPPGPPVFVGWVSAMPGFGAHVESQWEGGAGGKGGRWWVNKGELVKFSFKQKSKVNEHVKRCFFLRRALFISYSYYYILFAVFFGTIQRFFWKEQNDRWILPIGEVGNSARQQKGFRTATEKIIITFESSRDHQITQFYTPED